MQKESKDALAMVFASYIAVPALMMGVVWLVTKAYNLVCLLAGM